MISDKHAHDSGSVFNKQYRLDDIADRRDDTFNITVDFEWDSHRIVVDIVIYDSRRRGIVVCIDLENRLLMRIMNNE